MKIDIQEEKALAVIKNDVDNAENVSRLKVNSQPTLEKAKEARKIAKMAEKMIDEEEKKITKPLNDALKNTRDLFRPYKQRISTVIDWLDDQMLSYNKSLIKAQEEKAKQLEEDIKDGKTSFDSASKKIEKIEEKIDAIPTRKVPKVRILDKSKIPLEFMDPNESAIKKVLMSGNTVAGTELYYEETVTGNY